METVAIFGTIASAVSSVAGLFGGGKDEPQQVQQQQAPEREKAPKVDDVPQTPGMAQRAAVRKDRSASVGGGLNTRSGVAIVGGT